MKKTSLIYQLMLGLIIGVLLIPPRPAMAQWAVFDTKQYILQISKRATEAARWIEHYQKLVEQLTTMKGVLAQAEDLVGKENTAIATMANIGRTVRASFQLKEQLESLVTTRLNAIKRIDDRLKNGIFDPEQDLRDFDEYLRESIGRSSQDTIANRERLARMDNQLALWQREMALKEQKKSWAKGKQKETTELLSAEDRKQEAQKCASCIASLKEELATYEMLISQLDIEILDLRCQIENRVKQYNIRLEEQEKFGQQVMTMNEAWREFNDSLDELNRSLGKFD